jgi:hypothetical protein
MYRQKAYYKDGYIFRAPSRRINKKYDVFSEDDNYITSFGARKMTGEPYEQYEDLVSDFYSDYNHFDPKRRKLYRMRHRKDNINDPTSAGYFAWHYLW